MGFGIRCVAAFRIAPPNTRIGLEAVSAGPEMMEHHIARKPMAADRPVASQRCNRLPAAEDG